MRAAQRRHRRGRGDLRDCRKHFEQVTSSLKAWALFERNPHLVRGLDYYSRTAFEVAHGDLGAQNALGGGGRYDDLVQQLGGAAVPAIGFAVGLERVLMALTAGEAEAPGAGGPRAFIATVAVAQIPEGLKLAEWLRGQGIPCAANLEERPLKRQFEQASKLVPGGYTLVLGEDEVAKGVVMVKEMSTGKQEQVAREALPGKLGIQ